MGSSDGENWDPPGTHTWPGMAEHPGHQKAGSLARLLHMLVQEKNHRKLDFPLQSGGKCSLGNGWGHVRSSGCDLSDHVLEDQPASCHCTCQRLTPDRTRATCSAHPALDCLAVLRKGELQVGWAWNTAMVPPEFQVPQGVLSATWNWGCFKVQMQCVFVLLLFVPEYKNQLEVRCGALQTILAVNREKVRV